MVMDEDMEQAALKIQSTFRGHKVQKHDFYMYISKAVDFSFSSLFNLLHLPLIIYIIYVICIYVHVVVFIYNTNTVINKVLIF